MITEISSQYNVDIDRIYAAGYSNGGMMAYGLANYKSDLIAAVASVFGAMLECIGSNIHPMAVIHLHGISDGVLPYNGSIDWNATQSTLDHRINFSNTVLTPTITSDNNIERYGYDQGNSLVSVEHYKYIVGDHTAFFKTTKSTTF
jgi:polyhydroxybutyrate depolymerase